MWYQSEISLSPRERGYHLVTGEILEKVPEIDKIEKGLAHIFIKHTSASITINENNDPAVRRDFYTHFKRMVPEDTSLYEHTVEGPDDMTSHIKSSLLGSSVTIPITGGSFNFGTWQGIFLCEHRESKGSRTLVVTLHGE